MEAKSGFYEPPRWPVSVLVVGMAGSGKSTLMQRLNAHQRSAAKARGKGERPVYCVNLDPAVRECVFGANVDVRDTVKYNEVMTQYGLGPNGAIVTSLNLFATKFPQVIGLIEKRRAAGLRYALIDTPGQIEVFTWSASGQLITETLAAAFPTVLVYVVDVPRSVANPSTFVANMLYACSILYRTQLPLVLALTKTDVMSAETILEWMKDYDSFREALQRDPSYAHDLAGSMALVLDEFYSTLQAVGVSAVTGEGVDELFAAIDAAAEKDYFGSYLADKKDAYVKAQEAEAARQREQFDKLKRDLEIGKGGVLFKEIGKEDDDVGSFPPEDAADDAAQFDVHFHQ